MTRNNFASIIYCSRDWRDQYGRPILFSIGNMEQHVFDEYSAHSSSLFFFSLQFSLDFSQSDEYIYIFF